MSFTCFVTNEVVIGKSRVSVPILKRKVIYQNYVERADKGGDKHVTFIGDAAEGWEVAKEAFTTQEHEQTLREQYENNFLPEIKKVMVKVSPKFLARLREKAEADGFGYNRFS